MKVPNCGTLKASHPFLMRLCPTKNQYAARTGRKMRAANRRRKKKERSVSEQIAPPEPWVDEREFEDTCYYVPWYRTERFRRAVAWETKKSAKVAACCQEPQVAKEASPRPAPAARDPPQHGTPAPHTRTAPISNYGELWPFPHICRTRAASGACHPEKAPRLECAPFFSSEPGHANDSEVLFISLLLHRVLLLLTTSTPK